MRSAHGSPDPSAKSPSDSGRDLLAGQVIFRGQIDDVEGTELRATAQAIVAERLGDIYSQFDQFSASLRGADVLAVLQADDLRGLPTPWAKAGIGMTRVTPSGVELVVDTGPLATLLGEVRERANYGNEATGAHLERKFSFAAVMERPSRSFKL